MNDVYQHRKRHRIEHCRRSVVIVSRFKFLFETFTNCHDVVEMNFSKFEMRDLEKVESVLTDAELLQIQNLLKQIRIISTREPFAQIVEGFRFGAKFRDIFYHDETLFLNALFSIRMLYFYSNVRHFLH